MYITYLAASFVLPPYLYLNKIVGYENNEQHSTLETSISAKTFQTT